MKKLAELILTVLLSLSYFGCQKNTWQKKLASEDVKIWDSLTVAFIQKNCQLESKNQIPSREVETLEKMMELFKTDLKQRNIILETLRKNDVFYTQDTIYIIESLTYNDFNFDISFMDSLHSFHKKKNIFKEDNYKYSIKDEKDAISFYKTLGNCDTREIIGLAKMNYTIHSKLYYSDNKWKFNIQVVYLANKRKHSH